MRITKVRACRSLKRSCSSQLATSSPSSPNARLCSLSSTSSPSSSPPPPHLLPSPQSLPQPTFAACCVLLPSLRPFLPAPPPRNDDGRPLDHHLRFLLLARRFYHYYRILLVKHSFQPGSPASTSSLYHTTRLAVIHLSRRARRDLLAPAQKPPNPAKTSETPIQLSSIEATTPPRIVALHPQ